ncbi:MAG: hypothetical protein IT372_09675 [Polyangiaceae bacterium]|nr:hypothetical protein [Polyangiaceae bacterium]
MSRMKLSTPIFGAVARTRRGRERLRPEAMQRWAGAWPGALDPAAWWIDIDAGIALLRPEASIDRDGAAGGAALAIRGAVFGGGRAAPPSGWADLPAGRGSAAVLYDLLERDTAALSALRGQFALALWDGRRRSLLLARDPLGQRGLFVVNEPDLMVFCSELDPLLRAARPGCDLDPEGAAFYLSFGMPPPGRTLARGVDRVPAAHVLRWEPDRPARAERYWTPLDPDAPREATPEVVAAIRGALDRSITRLTGDGERLGVLLSGGVDSTYVATTASARAPGLRALCSEFEPEYGMNETEYAAAVSRWLGVDLHVAWLGARDALELLENVVLAAAEPCAAWAAMTHHRTLSVAREIGLSRVLSGLGADEIFGGYDHFRGYYVRYLRYVRRHPAPAGMDPFDALLLREDRPARRALYPGVARFFEDKPLRRAAPALGDLQQAPHLRAFYRDCRRLKPEAEVMEMMVAHECQHRIPDLLLANFEPISRGLSVEVSYPFLDPDLVRLVSGLSVESRYRTADGRFSIRLKDLHPRFKHAMLEVARDRVPDAIRDRPRKSLTAPFGGWMSDPAFAGPVLARLERSRLWDRGLLRREWLDRVKRRLVPGPSPWVCQLWALVTLAGWYDRYVDPPRAR